MVMTVAATLQLSLAIGQMMPVRWHITAQTDDSKLSLPQFIDPAHYEDTLAEVLSYLHRRSYVEASIDSVAIVGDTIEAFIHMGSAFHWGSLDLSGLPARLQRVPPPSPDGKPFDYTGLQTYFERLLQRAEEEGYPFAAVRLEGLQLVENAIRARVTMQLNEAVHIEKIELHGDAQIRMAYLRHHLDIKEGDLFSRGRIMAIRPVLESMPFLKITDDPTVEFLGSGAHLHIYADRANASQFDVLLGLMPSLMEDRRFQLTGDVKALLVNPFGSGERLQLNFQNLMPGTQQLDLRIAYPFVAKSPFGIEVKFDLYKRDTTYIDVNYRLGLQRHLRQANYIELFAEQLATFLTGVDTRRIRQTKKLPDFIDVRQRLFGLRYHLEQLDYRLNPRRGYDLTFDLSYGLRKILKNTTIASLKDTDDTGLSYERLYDDLVLQSARYRLQGRAAAFIPMLRSSTLKLGLATGYIGSAQGLFDNELFRIGGSRLLRGFNEESIFANLFSIATAEYRLLFDQRSFVFLFVDGGYYRRNSVSDITYGAPVGFGAGLNLETKVGIFAISYAVGRDVGSPLSLRSGRIHFGMVAGL